MGQIILITKAFYNSIRIVITEKIKDQIIKVTYKIFGKNLNEPFVEELSIKVIDIVNK